ncbi:MAG: heavy metal-responsive transcriptional regulator [Actinobacteria bacterium]|nr:heavy metal-responsive transcriptional regulator [Actinomycetota bacterium]
MTGLTIGKVAQAAGVGVETVRFYERKGLIARPVREGGTYRLYTLEAVARVRFIRRAKELGFTLREIAELLRLGTDPDSACDDVRLRAEAKIVAIDTKIDHLREMREALMELTRVCHEAPPGDCPFLRIVGTQTHG